MKDGLTRDLLDGKINLKKTELLESTTDEILKQLSNLDGYEKQIDKIYTLLDTLIPAYVGQIKRMRQSVSSLKVKDSSLTDKIYDAEVAFEESYDEILEKIAPLKDNREK